MKKRNILALVLALSLVVGLLAGCGGGGGRSSSGGRNRCGSGGPYDLDLGIIRFSIYSYQESFHRFVLHQKLVKWVSRENPHAGKGCVPVPAHSPS